MNVTAHPRFPLPRRRATANVAASVMAVCVLNGACEAGVGALQKTDPGATPPIPAAAVEAPSKVKPAASFVAASEAVAPLGRRVKFARPQNPIVLAALTTEAVTELERQDSVRPPGRLRVGVGRDLDQPISLNHESVTAAEWTVLPDGWHFWSVEITSPGAVGIRLRLESLTLPSGVRLLIYDPAQSAGGVASITSQALFGEREFWMPTVFSDTVALECQVPPGADPAEVEFAITSLSHLYRHPIATSESSRGPPKEGTCHNDVTCFPAWATTANGVARIAFVDGDSSYICTGCLLSDGDPNTFVDYFLTAFHCIGGQAVASTMECWWFFETSVCNGAPPSLSSVPRTSGGADFLAGSAANDFAFMRLRQASPGGVTYEGWTTASPGGAETLAGIHHPDGAYKRISFGNTPGADANFWEVQFSSGVTEGGSSGSPLFNANKQVIGQLESGFSSCSNPSGIDYYGRFNVTHTAVCPWLGGACAAGTNDICSGAVPLTNNVYYSQNTASANNDTGLPCLGAVHKGLWFTYTPSVSGTATVDTCTSDFDTMLEVFSGSCGSLVSLGCNDDGCGLQSSFSFPCSAGTTYRICAGGYLGASGPLRIRATAVASACTLNITRIGNQVVLSWGANCAGYVLESKTNLTTGIWIADPTSSPVTNAVTVGRKYYRLRKL